MNDPILNLLGYSQQLSSCKQMATASEISEPTAIRDSYENSFDAFVTAAYRWYGEAIRQDRDFLERSASKSDQAKLRGCLFILRDQRHDKEHNDYDRTADARAWREEAAASAAAGTEQDILLREALVKELETALQILCAVAQRVKVDSGFAKSWLQHTAATPEAEIQNVYSTIGLGRPRNFEYVVRQYESDPRRRSAHTPEGRAKIAQAAAIGIGLEPLSIAYDKLLDEFGLVGDPLGRSLLVLAHGVEASGHSADSTVSILRSVWPIVRESA